MGKKSKSIFNQPGVRKFQLVHRSQRDPLIHDPEASTHVFKPISTGKGKAKAETPLDLPSDADDREDKIGQAALYGIYYDDTEYDYLQHLRSIGENKDGVESVWIEAPNLTATKKEKKKEKSFFRDTEDDPYGDLPMEARPSNFELTREQAQRATEAMPEELSGLQPDMDPHLRQALEALEDEAFVVAEVRGIPANFDLKVKKPKAKESVVIESEGVEGEKGSDGGDEILDDADDFFAELVKDGEREEEEEVPWEFREEGLYEAEGGSSSDAEKDGGDEDWQTRFKRFQLSKAAHNGNEGDSDDEFEYDASRSEARDTVGQLPRLPVIGGKRRHKGTSDASGYSMSSSSMFRNAGLTTLDERFEEVEKEYLSDNDEDEEEEDDEAPELLNSSEHFNAIMDDFLDNYEILGGKMRHVMPGETPAEKLGTLRQTMTDQSVPIRLENLDDSDDNSDDLFREEIDKGDKWDCETILSTYSNLENHPKIIRAAKMKNVTKIALDPKTGLPSTGPLPDRKSKKASFQKPLENIAESDDDEGDLEQPRRATVTRSREETKEEKKARKLAVKEDRQARRSTKKVTQKEFSDERKQQIRQQREATAKGIRRL